MQVSLGKNSFRLTRLRVWLGVFLLLMAMFVFSSVQPLVAPYFIGRNCELPFTQGKKAELDALVEDVLKTPPRDGRTTYYKQLDHLNSDDRLYVMHHMMRRLGAIAHHSRIFRSKLSEQNLLGENSEDMIFGVIYEYKISPVRHGGIFTLLSPFVHIYRWSAIGFDWYVTVTANSLVSTEQSVVPVQTIDAGIKKSYGFPARSRKTIEKHGNGDNCPIPVRMLLPDQRLNNG